MHELTASNFVGELAELQSSDQRTNNERFVSTEGTEILGVRHKQVFDLAKESVDMPPREIEQLLENPYYEVRLGAVSIMDFQAQRSETTEEQREVLFDLYLTRHDRIDNWDFVDRAAKRVVGGYLYEFGEPRDVLTQLATSDDPWRRRTAIVATSYFIGHDDVDETYAIASLLVEDDHELVQKAVGSWIREAGKRDETKLREFLYTHAQEMPRTMLRLATEKLDEQQRAKYLNDRGP